jgi:hypothetical protein
MFTIETESGAKITGNDTRWHDLPADVRVKKLFLKVSAQIAGRMVTVADDGFAGFDAYGFQMYDIHGAQGQGVLSRGVQLLCVAGDGFLCTDINLSTGCRRGAWAPLATMTYNRALLRAGVRASG